MRAGLYSIAAVILGLVICCPLDAHSQTVKPKKVAGSVVDLNGTAAPGVEIEVLWAPSLAENLSLPDSEIVQLKSNARGQFKPQSGAASVTVPGGGVSRIRVTSPLAEDSIVVTADGTILDPFRTGDFTTIANPAKTVLTTGLLCSDQPGQTSYYGSCSNVVLNGAKCSACNANNCQTVRCPASVATSSAEPTPVQFASARMSTEPRLTSCTIVIWGAAWCPPCRKLKEALGCPVISSKDPAEIEAAKEACHKHLEETYPCLNIVFKDADKDEGAPSSIPAVFWTNPNGSTVGPQTGNIDLINSIAANPACRSCHSRCACSNPLNGGAVCSTIKSLLGAGWTVQQLASRPSCTNAASCTTYAREHCVPPSRCLCNQPNDGGSRCWEEKILVGAGYTPEQISAQPSCKTATECTGYAALKCAPKSRCFCKSPRDGSAGCYTDKSLVEAGWPIDEITSKPQCNGVAECTGFAAANCKPAPTPPPTSTPAATPTPIVMPPMP